MTKAIFFKTGALGALATALLMSALPAQAQAEDGQRNRGGRGQNAEVRADIRADTRGDRAQSRRQSQPTATARSDRGGERQQQRAPQRESARSQAYAQQAAAPQPQAEARAAAPARNTAYTAPRDRSYGAYGRSGSQGEQQARTVAAPSQRAAGASGQRDPRSSTRSSDRRDDNARRADWQQGRQAQARHTEARDDRRNYTNGYRDGRRSDNRYGNDNRRWDNRGWRNDNRYDWYRYRSTNRSLFSLGRYYSPYRGYNYSRLSIGFRLGSLFYSNRYWINDPYQYRLPEVYGPYRWIRYYNDALLVDIYSGEVVDVINNFFW